MKRRVTDIALIILSIFFVIGIRYWFPVCAPKSESFMSCHWAGEMLKTISWLLLLLYLIHSFIRDGKIKLGIDISSICILIVTANIPGQIIALCKSAAMQCRASTQLWTIVFCVVMMIITIADGILYLSNIEKEKHKR